MSKAIDEIFLREMKNKLSNASTNFLEIFIIFVSQLMYKLSRSKTTSLKPSKSSWSRRWLTQA